MLKETHRSLRQYFAFVAVISFLSAAGAIISQRWSALASWPVAVNTTFCLLFTFVAVRFHRLIARPALIRAVLATSAALSLLGFVLSLRSGIQVSSVATFVVSILIFVYLMRSVTRLSNESATKNA
jgi:hypothetical protein